jgi:hypothetical protein
MSHLIPHTPQPTAHGSSAIHPQVGRTGVKLTGSAPGQLPNIDMIFAASTASRLSDHLNDRAHQCSATVNFATGSTTTTESDLPRLIVIHGALMIAAWIALLPAGKLPAAGCCHAALMPAPAAVTCTAGKGV